MFVYGYLINNDKSHFISVASSVNKAVVSKETQRILVSNNKLILLVIINYQSNAIVSLQI